MAIVTRSLFKDMLANHDWYYAFSDDHRVYNRGRESYYALMDAARALKCPWTLFKMQKYISGLVVTNYYQPDTSKNEWYHNSTTNTRWSIGITEDMLLSEEEYNKINSWIKG